MVRCFWLYRLVNKTPLQAGSSSTMNGPALLTVYVRQGCHLCDEMIALLRDFQKDYNFTFEAIDVDSDEELYQRFNVLVPALLMGDREICHHFFDLSALQQALKLAPTGTADTSQANSSTDKQSPLTS